MNPKERRKNLVIGVLAVGAVAVVAWSFLAPKANPIRKPATASTGAPVANIPTPSPPDPAAPTQTLPAGLVPASPIDLATVRSRFQQWSEAPDRDPFLAVVPTPAVSKAAKSAPPQRAADRLFVRAIWRQSGNRLAVINDLVLGEGDRVAGYAIEKIDASQVWVRGTNGSEAIDFKVGATAANAARGGTGSTRGPAATGATATPERRMSP